MHALSEAAPKAPETEEGGCHLGHFDTEHTWRGPYHLHHDEYLPYRNYSCAPFQLSHSTFIRASQWNTCASFFHLHSPYSSLFLLFCIPHSLYLFISLLQALCATSDALCSTRDAAEEAERVTRHEGIKLTAPWQKWGGGHQQNIEKTTLTKGIRQQMGLAIECVESFKS